MDDKKLAKILSDDHAPQSDVNARKIAVNLAMAEFMAAQNKKNKKSSQGFSILSRLMGMSKTSKGRETMEKRTKFMFGGAATAVAVVLVAGLSLTQLDGTVQRYQVGQGAVVKAVNFHLDESVLPTASDVRATPGAQETSPAYVAALEVQNEEKEDPLRRWRQLQDKKVMQEMQPPAVSAVPPMIAGKGIAVIDSDAQIAQYQDEGRDKFEKAKPNAFKQVDVEPVSTFSSDVDTASYSFVRRQLNNGMWPNPDAVRVEEMINYFDYNYAVPDSREEPFQPNIAIIESPWAKGKKLMRIGIKGYDIQGEKPHTNLVFLLDVSGSMNEASKLPLVKASMKMLLDNLNSDDTVAIAVYAGAAGTVLEPTKVSERNKILGAIDNLSAGGSTAGAAGINLAYQLAEQNFDKDGVNRIILATDGDFNVGTANTDELKTLVEHKRESGIFLSVLGFGQGNYNDAIMQTLAQNGNGVAAYIDTLNEARKVLVEEAKSSLFPIAKDVKFQVEFNPKAVAEYRLVGYETRALNREDFNNDKIDAGDMGAGHTVTALYEFVPVGSSALSVDPLRYGDKVLTEEMPQRELANVKIRYKLPSESVSKLITRPVTVEDEAGYCPPLTKCKPSVPSADVQFATAVAGFAQILKGDTNISDMSLDDVIALAQAGKGEDLYGYRAEFINLVRLAKATQK